MTQTLSLQSQTLTLQSHEQELLCVLIVDDNQLNLRVLRQILSKKFSHLIHLPSLRTASSGPQALALLSQQIFHLLLLDISMPGMSGLEVARRIRSTLGPGDLLSPSTPPHHHPSSLILPPNRHLDICAVTTDLAHWQVDMYRRAGMNGVIGKPLKEDDIRHALLLSIGSSFSSSNLHPSNLLLHHSLSTPRFPQPSIDDPLLIPPSTTLLSQKKSRKRSLSAKTIYAGRARYPFFFRLNGSPHPLPLLSSCPLVLHSQPSHTSFPTIPPRFDPLQSFSSFSSPPFPLSASTGPTRLGTCTSLSSANTPWQQLDKTGSQETDPFAAGFGALLDAADDSADDTDDQWAVLRSQSQLLTRRSIPLFSSRNTPPHLHKHHPRHPPCQKRKTKSDCGSPTPLTFNLPWLGKKDQSVLREGPLLQELLGVLDIEDAC